jgi:hypothetical protein
MVFLYLEALVHRRRGIPLSKDSLCLLMVQYSKDSSVKKATNRGTVFTKSTLKFDSSGKCRNTMDAKRT